MAVSAAKPSGLRARATVIDEIASGMDSSGLLTRTIT